MELSLKLRTLTLKHLNLAIIINCEQEQHEFHATFPFKHLCAMQTCESVVVRFGKTNKESRATLPFIPSRSLRMTDKWV